MDPVRTVPTPEPFEPLRVCVAIQDDGLSGIETYAEQVAVASATAGHDTTLIVTTRQVASAVRAAFEPYVHGAEARFTASCWMVRARSNRH